MQEELLVGQVHGERVEEEGPSPGSHSLLNQARVMDSWNNLFLIIEKKECNGLQGHIQISLSSFLFLYPFVLEMCSSQSYDIIRRILPFKTLP